MNTALSGELFDVVISDIGAEIQSVKSKKTGTEFIWQGDPAFWPYRTPMLFPVCAATKNDKIVYEGVEYGLKKHGFTRAALFKLKSADAAKAVYSLTDSEETLKVYPFKFELEIIYRLEGDTIFVDYAVHNRTDGEMYYSVGGHEGYACPHHKEGKFTDYYIEFEQTGDYDVCEMNESGLTTGVTRRIISNGNILNLEHGLFVNDALVFKNVGSEKLWLKSRAAKEVVEVGIGSAENVFIWQKVGAGYICIEPLWGFPDAADTDGDITKKHSIRRLEKGASETLTHYIKITE